MAGRPDRATNNVMVPARDPALRDRPTVADIAQDQEWSASSLRRLRVHCPQLSTVLDLHLELLSCLHGEGKRRQQF